MTSTPDPTTAGTPAETPTDQPSGAVTFTDDGSLWTMRGEIDVAVMQRSQEALSHALRERPARITVDVGAVTFMDSSGLRMLYTAVSASEDRPRLVNVPRRVRDLLEISGVTALFELEPADA